MQKNDGFDNAFGCVGLLGFGFIFAVFITNTLAQPHRTSCGSLSNKQIVYQIGGDAAYFDTVIDGERKTVKGKATESGRYCESTTKTWLGTTIKGEFK